MHSSGTSHRHGVVGRHARVRKRGEQLERSGQLNERWPSIRGHAHQSVHLQLPSGHAAQRELLPDQPVVKRKRVRGLLPDQPVVRRSLRTSYFLLCPCQLFKVVLMWFKKYLDLNNGRNLRLNFPRSHNGMGSFILFLLGLDVPWKSSR